MQRQFYYTFFRMSRESNQKLIDVNIINKVYILLYCMIYQTIHDYHKNLKKRGWRRE